MSPDPARSAGGMAPGGSGLFVAVVGPSGAGKDTLLALAAEDLAKTPGIVFARRIVTRDAIAAIEDHDVMSPADFAAAEASGAFCLSWRAHGLAYGLPAYLTTALTDGTTVVANVSRRVFAEAAERFARLAIVEITAPPAVLIARIAARGREAPEEISARIARQVELTVPPGAEAHHRIVNDASPQDGRRKLVEILRAAS
ncbi:putative PhnN protein involved in phosphonate metabolism [Aurantimonas manganoxydans SI85-9A1]|uniref:Ribose 1,5-bisphosphate phosphokinase PhnN n=2 Tax=Aurantimonas manganoxydans TaxID=651183 RepID=Q1YEY5_AURMS|nr:putative PhnN protein involved in phosphonate metabolism [Aurantimonas manganoxydans SI85-9A1]